MLRLALARLSLSTIVGLVREGYKVRKSVENSTLDQEIFHFFFLLFFFGGGGVPLSPHLSKICENYFSVFQGKKYYGWKFPPSFFSYFV